MYNNTIFIHRRDYRITDNTGLVFCLQNTQKNVYPLFIFNKVQVDEKENKYYNSNSIQFLVESLKDLQEQYKEKSGHLSIFYDKELNLLKRLVVDLGIDCIVENADYSPFAKKRSKDLISLCNDLGIEYKSFDDLLLIKNMGALLKSDKGVYKKFTPFYNNAKHHFSQIEKPVKQFDASKLNKKKLLKEYNHMTSLYTNNDNLKQNGGRKNALSNLKTIKKITDYNESRNFPYVETTNFSAHLRFGTISIREMFFHTGKTHGIDSTIIQQLFWREFYMYLINFLHTNYSKKSDTKPSVNEIKWSNSKKKLEKWKKGETGCPFVDAGMRQMNKTGWMHNRLRMVCATYLIYYLQIHWKEGEEYFAKQLLDYDYINNLGGWLWCSAWEVHSNDYYKAFSMESQMKRFDPDAIYVKTWIPELSNIPAKELYVYEKHYNKLKDSVDYCEPIIFDMKSARKEGVDLYKKK